MGISHGIERLLSILEGQLTEGDDTLVLLGEPSDQTLDTPPGAPCESAEHAIPDAPTDGCWQPACEYAKLTSHYTITIQAGQSLSWPYVVLDGFNERCLPAGTYMFEETSPIAYGQLGDTPVPTPPGGYAQQIRKRLELTLESDGTLTADARVQAAS